MTVALAVPATMPVSVPMTLTLTLTAPGGRRPSTAVAAVVAVLLVTAVAAPPLAGPVRADAPTAGFDDGTFDAFTLDRSGLLNPFGFDVSGAVVSHGAERDPSWHVWVGGGDLSSLREWANASSERELLRQFNDSDYAVVRAPAADVGARLADRWFGSGLAAAPYVDRIAVDRAVGLPQPVKPLDSRDSFPTESGFGGLRGTLRRTGAGLREPGDQSIRPGGIAYEENANTSTLKQGRNVTGVDNVSADVDGSGIIIAVVDTGANTDGGEVFGNGTDGSTLRIDNASKNFISGKSVNVSGSNFGPIEDGNGHGTWVAAAAAANTTNESYDGVAPNATLLVLKALADDGSGSTSDIAAAIRYAADNGADVLSMSLGSPVYSPALDDAIQYAFDEGVSAVVVAAGNSRRTTRWVATPADVDGVIAVAATNTTRPGSAASAYFSQVGPDPGTTDFSRGATQGERITIAAPGMLVEAQVPRQSGGHRKRTLSGTSMSTPVVAGAVALLLDSEAGVTGEETAIRERVRESARPMPVAAEAEVGGGMLAVDRLLDDDRDGSQRSAMSTRAEARDGFWRGLSASSGGLLPLALSTAEVTRVG